MSAFNNALAFSLHIEAGYVNDPVDRGGPTNFGITLATFNSAKQRGVISSTIVSVKDITQQDAINIYQVMYWNTNNLDEVAKVSPDLSIAIFDFLVNSGTNAVTTLQGLLGITQDGALGAQTLAAIQANSNNSVLLSSYIQARKDFYAAIIANDPTQVRFKKGWNDRLIQLQQYLTSSQNSFSSNDTSLISNTNTWTVGPGATGDLIAAASGHHACPTLSG
jgi:lysozyme family protein